ncbi:MAG: hypothetical protein IJC15_04980 [Clostridia bacterium]|nr:hypothetical protein [Clostridia bacterium]
MLHIMPLFWCAVLIVLFLTHVYAEITVSSAVWASVTALALAIAGFPPWLQSLSLAVVRLLCRLLAIIWDKNHPTVR